MIRQIRLWLAPAYLVFCVLLGGASAAGHLANLVLQLLAVLIIAWALVRPLDSPSETSSRQLLWIGCFALLLIIAQLVPLPPSIWANLPGRQVVLDGYELLGLAPDWAPLSLDPTATMRSALSLLPAFAVALAMLRLDSNDPSKVAWAIVGAAGLSVFVGMHQVLGGPGSSSYFYSITNLGSTVGFFANANHLASLLVVAVPFTVALFLASSSRRHSLQRRTAAKILTAGLASLLLIGVAINGSRAGFALAIASSVGSVAMIVFRRRSAPRWLGWAALALIVAAAGLSAGGSVSSSIAKLGEAHSTIGRYVIFGRSLDAAADYAPVGSGVGTFQDVYRTFENPYEVTRTYVNHVHNDYIEALIEAGLPGLVLILLFFVWWARGASSAWREAGANSPFARAATVATAALLTHSFADYPLRTAALLAIFTACCVLMTRLNAAPRPSQSKQVPNPRHLSAD